MCIPGPFPELRCERWPGTAAPCWSPGGRSGQKCMTLKAPVSANPTLLHLLSAAAVRKFGGGCRGWRKNDVTLGAGNESGFASNPERIPGSDGLQTGLPMSDFDGWDGFPVKSLLTLSSFLQKQTSKKEGKKQTTGIYTMHGPCCPVVCT